MSSIPSREEFKKQRTLPRHVAIVMDGNSRWATANRKSVRAGHKAGVDAVRELIECCPKYDIEVLTLFAFSTENWQRPAREVKTLLALLSWALRAETPRLNKNNVRLKIIGNRDNFPPRVIARIEEAERLTAGNTAWTLVVAVDYGGRWDLSQATKQIALDLASNKISEQQITPELIGQYTCLSDMPDPDLCIRTAGDHRISNFMLWQFAYTELYFTDLFWPDFDEQAFKAALYEFASRQRRFGKRDDDTSNE
ncbi:MAG: di-trans,poly-cis-decaprenylcistransferase [Pseudomonadales bacterium]|nr:di-trans,poly-cis-decaprenylcistransferase [Pseudomonadales bacterium]